MRPNYTLLKTGEALDKSEKGSAVSQDLGKAFNTICLNLLLQKPKAYKVFGSLFDVYPVYVYWHLENESKWNLKKRKTNKSMAMHIRSID